MNDVFSVRGKNVVVTGGGGGVGFAIAKRFADSGANVLIADIDERAAFTAAEKLATDPAKIGAMALDVASDGAGEAMVQRCVKAFGGLDVLINNANIYPQVPMLKMSPELFDRVWRVNVRALALASKAAALRMVEQKSGGSIINMGSVDSLHPSMAGLAAYDTSKGAVLTFTRNFALELASQRIRVNAILPGVVETDHGPMVPLSPRVPVAVFTALKEQLVKTRVPMGRMATGDDIARVAVFLAAEASNYITGASIVVDGGMLLT